MGVVMATKHGYFNDLNRLLAAMSPEMLDMHPIEANERHHGHTFHDVPETVWTMPRLP
jgi:hypothetical protein